jgi:carboxymethylenebutenolidase
MEKEIKNLYSDFKNGLVSRRMFLKRLAIITGSSAAALSLFPMLEENEIPAAVKPKKELPLITEFIKYPAATGEMTAFLARPKKGKKFPAVIVIHENRGLVPHIQEVTKRMAKEGFLSLAPDALSPLGGTPSDPVKVPEMLKQLNSEETTKNFVAAVKYLKTNPLSNGKVGCTGFCWGGGMTNQVAVNAPDLDAAVPYYGMQPAPADVEKI